MYKRIRSVPSIIVFILSDILPVDFFLFLSSDFIYDINLSSNAIRFLIYKIAVYLSKDFYMNGEFLSVLK